MEQDRLANIYYFVDDDGNIPVKEFIRSLTLKEQAKIYAYIRELKKEGNNLRRPMADYLVKSIYELRSKRNRIFYFFYLKNNAVLVHAIKKKTDIIHVNDLKLYLRRKSQIEAGCDYIQKLELRGDL